MPVLSEDRLQAMLIDGRITALTLDTNIFDAKRLNLSSPAFRAIAGLKELPFPVVISSTVAREVSSHLARNADATRREAKNVIGEALFAHDVLQPTRDGILEQVTGGATPQQAAAAKWAKFVNDTQCETLDDVNLVTVDALYEGYFSGRPPFSQGKKAEFPDALALNALERAAADRGAGILVVSEDRDWQAFCKESPRLYLVPKLEAALALVTNAPLGLRRAVLGWISDSQDGRAETEVIIGAAVNQLDIDVEGYASSGEAEFSPWAPEFRGIDWPANQSDIYIIETEELEGGGFIATLSIPVAIRADVSIEVSFSVWDSVDRESVGMGGRNIEFEHTEDAMLTVKVEVHGLDTEDVEFGLVDAEIDTSRLGVDLGEIEVFEREDYYQGEDDE